MNWNIIKKELIKNLKRTFESSPTTFSSSFDNSVDLLLSAIVYKTGRFNLDGSSAFLLDTIYKAYVTNKGEIEPLRVLAQELEPFLKKIFYIINGVDYSTNHHKSLAPLMVELNLSTVLLNRGNQKFPDILNETNLEGYKNEPEFLYQLCHSYIIRNEVHKSPDWDNIEVLTGLKSVMTIYIYAIIKHFDDLKEKVVISSNSSDLTENLFAQHEKIMYDYISFGSNSSEIKKSILLSFILLQINEKREVDIVTLKKIADDHFKSTTDMQFFKRIINELRNDKKIEYSDDKKTAIKLCESEAQRLKLALDEYNVKEKYFLESINSVLIQYGLSDKIGDIVNELKHLIENNYKIDVNEVYNYNEDLSNYSQLKSLSEHLRKIIDEAKVNDLIKALLRVCEQNDFLHKAAIGRVFASLSNPTMLQNYIRLQERVIFLDTNVLLYGLCYWYSKEAGFQNHYYKIVHDLFEYKETHKNIVFYSSPLYLSEVIFHLKNALRMIPFEEIGVFEEIGNSDNVFYTYYINLKSNGKLDDGVETFEDFFDAFQFSYDLTYEPDFFNIVMPVVQEYLEDLGIKFYDIEKVGINHRATQVFKNTISKTAKVRDDLPIINDASMLFFLSENRDFASDPIFTTWDRAFYNARKEYANKFRGSRTWYLFNPSKLLNHLSLLEFEINPKSVSNEFFSIIDADNIFEKTNHFFDRLNILLDIGKEEKRRYILKMKEFNLMYVYPESEKMDHVEAEGRPVAGLIKGITEHYTTKEMHLDLKNLIGSPEYFDKIIEILKSALDSLVTIFSIDPSVFVELDKLIKENKENINKGNENQI